ncbi:hypothetical protein F8M41_023982 [Gigaspora margarita]|uniref:Uncharacterized protein n=1 Tax=Gigaspora margarita TaxID=4874 RepID=A0A8H4B510_GIGMA|nr:hypothetical protein F8M41_023982 [Gigaspora margarita]
MKNHPILMIIFIKNYLQNIRQNDPSINKEKVLIKETIKFLEAKEREKIELIEKKEAEKLALLEKKEAKKLEIIEKKEAEKQELIFKLIEKRESSMRFLWFF